MSDPVYVVWETALGTFTIEVHTSVAPQTARYVLDLVDAGCFHGATFYRSTHFGIAGRRPLIQGGPLAPLFTGSGATIPEVELLDTVETTSLTGLRHRRGTVSLARDLLSTGHVLPELFICLDDYPELDAGGRSEPDSQGFPAFARVVDGLDVVESIAAQATDGASPVSRLVGEVLTSPVPILSATRQPRPTESST
jgi:peptidyl-prolyl cis-trans isomerase A (cyclophilin A)